MGYKRLTDHQHHIQKKVCKTSVSSVSTHKSLCINNLQRWQMETDYFSSASICNRYNSLCIKKKTKQKQMKHYIASNLTKNKTQLNHL